MFILLLETTGHGEVSVEVDGGVGGVVETRGDRSEEGYSVQGL